MRKKVIIMGAAGRDFHNFNMVFRNNPNYQVVAFTASQIPNIAGRKYPAELAGKLYPNGIPIYDESKLAQLVQKHGADEIILAYSDLHHLDVMHKASLALSLGCDFRLIGPKQTMLKAKKPVIAVTAVRTGCGKSQTTRKICRILLDHGKNIAVVRHPMPYGDLRKQVCQRFKKMADLDRYHCTIEEREEYEPLLEMGVMLFAGVDYAKILKEAEKADIIVWDGGNNDFPFFKPNLHITIVDPLRPKHEISYWPGEVNLRLADVVIVNKEKSAKPRNVKIVKNNVRRYNPSAIIIDARSVIKVNKPELIKGKKVLVVEDGPTLTHGGMPFGAGMLAALHYKAKPIDPRPYAIGSLKDVFRTYKHLKKVLPAMGYGEIQIKELEKTINSIPADAVISGTPIDLRRIIKTNKPIVRIRYELQEIGKPTLSDILRKVLAKFF